ncbi:MAG TPA: hypothetical protein VFR23_10360 [Jiangellaceae bacterium]|nr:hypothetical protein [Jiangellaceae bacterium]
MRRPARRLQAERDEVRRTVSALMDDAPEWRDWLERQLWLLDLEYDPHHWITFERIRG